MFLVFFTVIFCSEGEVSDGVISNQSDWRLIGVFCHVINVYQEEHRPPNCLPLSDTLRPSTPIPHQWVNASTIPVTDSDIISIPYSWPGLFTYIEGILVNTCSLPFSYLSIEPSINTHKRWEPTSEIPVKWQEVGYNKTVSLTDWLGYSHLQWGGKQKRFDIDEQPINWC